MKRLLHLTLVAATAFATGTVAGCGDDAEPKVSSDPPIDGGSTPPEDGGSLDAADGGTRPPFDPAPPAITCAVTPCITRLVAGPTHYCAIASDGVVRCWGNPSALGEFGGTSSSGDPGATPVVLEGMTGVVDIGAASLRTCVAYADGNVDCFGRDVPMPTRVPGVTGAKKLAIGSERSCAVTGDGGLTCWGDSKATGEGTGPVSLPAGKAGSVAMSTPVAFAVADDGALFSWGADPLMLGRDTPLDVDWSPGRVQELPSALQVAASDRHVCAVTTDGRLYCWGHGDDGALGLGSIRSVSFPMEVFFPGPAYPAQVAVAVTHSCVRTTDGLVSCWARKNTSGELGYGDLTGVFIPTKVTLPKLTAAVATGTGSTCALATDGSVWCWGDNAYGQLGLGRRDADRHGTPTMVVFP